MKDSTRTAVRQIIESDETITFSQKTNALKVLSDAQRQRIVEVVRYRDARKLLNISQTTLCYLVKQGHLLIVKSPKNRTLGIRSDSLAQYAQPKVKKGGILYPVTTYQQAKGQL